MQNKPLRKPTVYKVKNKDLKRGFFPGWDQVE